MTEHYRGPEDEQQGPSRWLRNRWRYGSVYVLDIDNLICTTDGHRGLLIEWKHRDAKDKTWRICRILAQKLGWWSALFVYVDDAAGNPTEIVAYFRDPRGQRYKPIALDEAEFDDWVVREFGAEHRHQAAA